MRFDKMLPTLNETGLVTRNGWVQLPNPGFIKGVLEHTLSTLMSK